MYNMKTEKQKMLDGELYMAWDPELTREREYARRMTRMYNQTTEMDGELRVQILKELLGSTGKNLGMEPNIRFDYGYNIYVGENFYTNFDVLSWMCARFGLAITVCLGQEFISIRPHIL